MDNYDLDQYIGTPLNQDFCDMFKRYIKGLLELQNPIEDLIIICDETNNTPDDIANGIINAHVYTPIPLIEINGFIDGDGNFTSI